ncbi:hypothetical protein LNQ03_22825 [Klebsiella pneumoniae subsp. pneumoniae]|nr:hypothetical protein [Klebsiella pneumoniae subsp. pneumoniae]
MLSHLFFFARIDPAGLGCQRYWKAPASRASKDPATFRTGWGVLLLLLAGFFVLNRWGSRSA